MEDSGHGVEAVRKAGMYCIELDRIVKLEQVSSATMVVSFYKRIDLDKIFVY